VSHVDRRILQEDYGRVGGRFFERLEQRKKNIPAPKAVMLNDGKKRRGRVLSLGRFFFFFCNQIVIMFKGTKGSCSVSYGDKKPISKRLPARFTSS